MAARFILQPIARRILGTSVLLVPVSLWGLSHKASDESYGAFIMQAPMALARFANASVVGALCIWDYHTLPENDGSKEWRAARDRAHESSSKRLLWLAETNRGLFIKAGQHLAAMDHILPPQYTTTLSKLQDQAPAKSFESVRTTFTEEFGVPPEKIFEYFDPEPIAAASLAQVHRAALDDGVPLAVKVQFAGLTGMCKRDIETIEFITFWVSKIFPGFKFGWMLDEFKENLPRELNFAREAENAERFAADFAEWPNITTPKIIWGLTSSRVLTMTFEEGVKISDTQEIKRLGIDPKDVSRLLNACFNRQIFQTGFVHSDPHPGNILVRVLTDPDARTTATVASSSSDESAESSSSSSSDGILASTAALISAQRRRKPKPKPQLVVLDHGLYREVNPGFRQMYARLWYSILNRKESKIRASCDELGIDQEQCQLFATLITARSWESTLSNLNSSVTKEERKWLGDLARDRLQEITGVLDSAPREILLLLKTNDLLRNINRTLQSDNTFSSIAEAVTRTIYGTFSFHYIWLRARLAFLSLFYGVS